jgi:HEAT repeat protein
MQHPPYPAADLIGDAIWVGVFVLSSVLCWKSNLHLRRTIPLLLLFLLSSRLLLGSGGGMLFLVELPVLLVLLIVSVRNLFGGAKDWDAVPPAEKTAHRRKVRHRWAIAMSVILGAGLLGWGGTKLYWFVRRATTPSVRIASVPFSRDLVLKAGEACSFVLPNDKTVAVWCENRGGIARAMTGHDLDLAYGEKPFQTLEWEKIPLPERNGYTFGDLISYIRSGGTIQSNDEFEYVFYVGEYRVGLKEKRVGDDCINMTVVVRQATEKEKLHGNAEREHYVKQLKSDDSSKRLAAIEQLQEMAVVGSMYAGDPKDMIATMRPLTEDRDPKIQAAARLYLCQMGDEKSLLALVTPEPKGEWRSSGGASRIAHWCVRHKSPAVSKHVLSFFEANDETLLLFAVAFFARTDDPVPKPQMLIALRHKSPEIRATAVPAIRFLCKPQETASHLIPLLHDPSKQVVLAALLEANWVSQAIPPGELTRLLQDHDPEVRRMAAYALESCRSPVVIDPLLEATKDSAASVRAQAAVSLGRIAEPKAYTRLLEMLADGDAEVRESAVNGLRWLGNAAAIPAVKKLQDDPDKNVRQMAKRTVGELRSKQ